MARTEIRGGQIKDETIDSADIASGSIKAGEISAQAISGQTLITEPSGASDRLLIWDATDSSLKQVAPDGLFTEDDTRVGIGTGTDAPDNTLHVKSPNTCHVKIESEAGYLAALRIKAGGQSSAYIWAPADRSDLRFYVDGDDVMHMDNDGNIGIATTDPDRKLDILDATDPQLRLTQAEGTKYVDMQANAAGDLVITGVSTDTDHSHLKFIAAGNAAMLIQSQAADGDAQLGFSVDAGSSLAFSIGVDDGDSDKFKIGTSTIDTNTRMTIDSAGDVGIGTTDPDYNLHVASAAAAVVLIDGASNADAFLRFGQNGTLKSYIKQGSGGHLVMTNETADKDIIFNIKDNTISREGLRLNGNVAEVVVNEGSDSLVDFRVESNSNTHMLYVDGGNNTTGINTSTPGSGFAVNSSFSLKVAGPKTSAYSIAEDDSCVTGDCNSAAVTLTLPSATDAMLGRIYTIKRLDSGNSGGGNMLTISRNGKNIDGIAGDVLLANLDAVVLQCIGVAGGWIRIGSFLAPI